MSDPVIHVSFPQPPDRFPTVLHWHAQISCKVHGALTARFGERVRFTPWDAPLAPSGRDVLVSFLPHPALRTWKRSVVVENANFDVDKWRFGAFRRFGLDAPLDPVRETYTWLEGQFALVILSNDAAMRRVAARDPQVAACWDYLAAAARRVSVHPHPIDKVVFSRHYDPAVTPDRVRMLVYHAGGRKNSQQLIDTLRAIGMRENSDFSVAPFIHKDRADLMAFLRAHFLIVANTSYAETGPINMLEFLLSGFAVYGHEDWWDGVGNPDFAWTYDPSRQEENRAALTRILRSAPAAIAAERDRMRRAFMERADNEWPVLTGRIGDLVAELLESDHAGDPT